MTTAIEKRVEDIATEINAIKRQTVQSMIVSAVEIGRLLCEAKEKVKHGEWSSWLSDNVSYSVSNANNMMRLYREHQGEQVDVFEGLNLSQAISLLSLPREERREFVEQNDVKEMSTRELDEAIRAKKAAEEEAKTVRERLEEAETLLSEKEALEEELSSKLKEVEKALEAKGNSASPSPADVDALEKKIAAKYAEEVKKKIEKIQKSFDKDKNELLKKTEEEKKKAADVLAAEKERIIADAKAAAEAESSAKIAELEAKAKKAVLTSSEYLVKFKEHLALFQAEFKIMTTIAADAEANEPEIGAQIREVLKTLVARLEAKDA